jgi:MscS family membrane protein
VPAGAARSFIDATRARDYDEATRHLDLSAIPAAERATAGPRLARWLKTVLDRKLWIHYDKLSDEPTGAPQAEDGLSPNLDRVGSIDDVEILLERVRDGQKRVWKFAAGTVEAIPELYGRYGDGRLGEILPSWMFEVEFLHVALWQWLGLIVLVLAAALLSWVVEWTLMAAIRPLVARTKTAFDDELIAALHAPLRFAAAVTVVAAGRYALVLSVWASTVLGHVLAVLAIIAVTWCVLRSVDFSAAAVRRHLEATGRSRVTAVIPMCRRSTKVLLGVVAFIVILANLGVNVTGLLAGLGVGGLAVALAAQKTLANLFGGVSLITDQPVRVGDLCRFGGTTMGTVEEIGLRSTRVRTPDRTLVSIPNAEFSEMQLENFAARERIRLYATLGLRYETTPDQLRAVLAEIRKLLVAHPRIAADPARVRLIGLGLQALELEIFAYVETAELEEFLAVREDILLRIVDIVAACGTGFAFPSQTLYLGRDRGLDRTRAEAAEARVRGWRERNEVPFPDYPPEALAALDGTLEYPPPGTPGARRRG